ncbi:peroxidase 4 [Phtheirospermum japonicum]|uniref:Peroxidase n=1 Tax=Phtheirospermum japonicum TaxID=374723 RepID=A0A830CUL0_9LAMI|nr:peroxidase 4 [Phtheirospermum japonicum]
MLSSSAKLSEHFYDSSCPKLLRIVRETVQDEIKKEPRMGASLLRLHFHDCFVNGCDGSILLDDTSNSGEKNAGPNLNSVRGFEVIDRMRSNVNNNCKGGVVSCADILALAARESAVQLGGPGWHLLLGRRDAKTANNAAAAKNLPSPTSNLNDLIKRFQNFNFTITDLVALSGAHTIGQARCTNFRTRIYNETNIDSTFAQTLKGNCSKTSGKGDDNNLAALDLQTPKVFDNSYYTNLVNKKGLLHSDQQLFNGDKRTSWIVKKYLKNESAFFDDFSKAMTKMSLLSPLTEFNQGEIRINCRKRN